MSSKILNCIFSLVLWVSVAGLAQAPANKDSVRESFKPTGIRVGMDAISLIKTFSTQDFKGWEVNADMDFRNYYPVVEIGRWQRDVVLENGHYTNAGNYMRVGVDVNFLKKDPVKNMFFFGLRIGHSQYQEKLDYVVTTTAFGSANKTLENTNLNSGWLEFTTGLKVRIFKSFWMGYTGRIKFAPRLHTDLALQSYDIPGYGLTFKKQWLGFNYYLMMKLPLPKRK